LLFEPCSVTDQAMGLVLVVGTLLAYAAGLECPHPLGIGIPSREKSRGASHVGYAVASER
jgi:hypothetical protein